MIVKVLFTISALAVLLPIRDVSAVEPISTAELAEHCAQYSKDRNGKDGVFCVRYIQGFIDGAVVTDERVARNVAAGYERKETLTERAMRTRGASRLQKRFATYYAEFCLGAPVPLKEVIEKAVDGLTDRQVVAEQTLARVTIYQMLRREYPCEKDHDK